MATNDPSQVLPATNDPFSGEDEPFGCTDLYVDSRERPRPRCIRQTNDCMCFIGRRSGVYTVVVVEGLILLFLVVSMTE